MDGWMGLSYTAVTPRASLKSDAKNRKKDRVKLGLCASLLAPSSIDGWVSCNEEVPK